MGNQSGKMTPEQATAMLEGVAMRARERLLPFMQDDYSGHYPTGADREFAVSRTMKQVAEAPDLSTATLGGYCGHAQHFADAELQSMGLKAHWYTLEKAATGEVAKQYQGNGLAPVSELLNNKSTQNHVALTVEIETTAGPKQYLIDPTFKQFRTADAQSPGRLLESSLGGGLEKTGVIELTPESAKSYIAAFTGGESPHATPQESMDFLTALPDRRQSRGSFPPAEYLDSKSPAAAATAAPRPFAQLPALSAAETAETLKGWYLLRSYNDKFDPLSTVMDLPKAEAIGVMERIHPHRGIGPADAGGNRNQSAYHQLRSEADSWVRSNSSAIKTRENPVFFALTNDPETVRAHMNSPGTNVIMTPVNEADLSKFSFTFDDSMGNYRTTVLDTKTTGINGEFLPDVNPVHGRVMNTEQLAAAIKSQGTLDAHGAPRNIEAQYWGAEPVKAQTLVYDPNLPKPPPRVAPEKTYTIRQVRPGDQTDLYRLMGGADSALDTTNPRHPINEIARLMEVSQNPDAQGSAWMAVTPEGRGVGVITTKDFNGGIFVETDYRRMGIAESLVLERESFQFARGETVAHAQIKAGNGASLRLHEKLGYTLDAGSEGDPALRDPETVLRLTKQLDDKTAGQMPASKPPAAEPDDGIFVASGGAMTLGAKINNSVDGAMGALGLVNGTMGAIRAAKEGDEVGVVINTANAASGGAALGISIARGMGHELAPALGSTVMKANIALTVATGFYQVAAEKGNFIDTEADGSRNLGNKGERAVAVVATSVTAIGLGAAGVGSVGVVPAVVAVAVVGDKAIEARRAWKDVDRTIAENGEPQRRSITDDDGSPDLRKFGHIVPEMLEVSKDMRDSALPFKPKRDARTGRIDFEDIRKLLASEDPAVIAEFEHALDANIRKQQQAMKDNNSILPKWLRFDDGGTKYTTAQMILSDLQGAKTELGWYKADTVAWNAAHPNAPDEKTTSNQTYSRASIAVKPTL